MIEGILESYWATDSNGTSFKWDYARCSAKYLQERTIIFSKTSRVRTLHYLTVHNMIYLHNRRSQLGLEGGDTLCSYYGMSLTFDNYGRPLKSWVKNVNSMWTLITLFKLPNCWSN